jgi:DNA replication protein DnaC
LAVNDLRSTILHTKHKFFRTGIPPEFFGANPRHINLNTDQKNITDKWAKDPNGNFFIWGEPGRGKSYFAIALMYYLEQAKKIPWTEMMFVEAPLMYQEWLSNISNYQENYSMLLKLKDKRVIIFDDVGVKKPSEGFLEFFHVAVNSRLNQPELITIFTTNLNAKEFNETLGPRLVSRICSGIKIELKGSDLRRKNNFDPIS